MHQNKTNLKLANLLSTAKEPQLFILMLLASYAAVSALLFTPAIPELSKIFGIGSSEVQLSMSVFLIGYAFGNLPYGPISNRFGRKPSIYFGILLSIIGSILVILSAKTQFFGLFILGRFLTALGSTAGLKIAFTMIGDIYKDASATKKISRLMLAFAIAPGLSVAIGGFLTSQFGWESCFYFLMLYGAFLFGASIFLPETYPKRDLQALNLIRIKNGYLQELKNRSFMIGALLMGCSTTFVYLFASYAPLIGINHLGLTPESYGLLNIIPPIGMLAGLLLSHALSTRKKTSYVILLGIGFSFAAAVCMLLFFSFDLITVASLFLPMPVIYFGTCLVSSNSSALAMSNGHNKSNASAMLNFINMSVATVILFLVEPFSFLKFSIMPVCFIIICLVMIFLTKFFKKKEMGLR